MLFQKKKRFPSDWAVLLAGVGTGIAMIFLPRLLRGKGLVFNNRVVVITGGSRGLGLQMARQLAAEGARLALLSRNEPELEQTRMELARRGAQVLAISCDVGEKDQVESALDRVMQRFGRIDVLINNAGVIQVGPLDHMRVEDYQNAMDVHFWGPLYAMLKVIPIMRRQGGGRIVNVSSIGGRVAVPHLAPYNASKFALTGLSDTFRAELARDGIAVSTITPGLMRTGSYYHGNFKGQNEKEFAWFTLMGTNPAFAMDSRRAAKQVIDAARFGTSSRTLTLQARLLQLADEIAPNLTAWVQKIAGRMMPEPAGVEGEQLRTGFESQSKTAPSWATRLGDRAAEQNNELIAGRG